MSDVFAEHNGTFPGVFFLLSDDVYHRLVLLFWLFSIFCFHEELCCGDDFYDVVLRPFFEDGFLIAVDQPWNFG